MKISLAMSLIVAALSVPAMSYAQSNTDPTTRADVNAQIVQAEQNGTLHQSKNGYPDYSTAQSGTSANARSNEGYGSMPLNFSQSGGPSNTMSGNSTFAHH
jgi:Domain of unknown function (DUF4148)